MISRNEVGSPCFLLTSAGLFIRSPLIIYHWQVPAKIISLSHCRGCIYLLMPKACIPYLLAQSRWSRRNELSIALCQPYNSRSPGYYQSPQTSKRQFINTSGWANLLPTVQDRWEFSDQNRLTEECRSLQLQIKNAKSALNYRHCKKRIY